MSLPLPKRRYIHIAQRQEDLRILKLKSEGKKVYSISKLNTIENCPYEAYRTYILHDKGEDGVYGIMGTRIHDVLESIVTDQATTADLYPALVDELENLAVLGLDFPKDFRGGTGIRDSWVADMTHFCNHFTRPNGSFSTEELFILKLDEDHYLQGYIDLIRHNKNGSISIFDWKTSTNFSAEDLIHHGRQLVTYALAKQQQGFAVSTVAWIMLKYCEVAYLGKARKNAKAETSIVKVVNRGKLIAELKDAIESKLAAAGLDELEIEFAMSQARAANSLDSLPEEVQSQFSIKPYVRIYPLTDDVIAETKDYIWRMICEFESRGKAESEWQPRSFVKSNGKEDTFYCNVLCNHRHTCPHIRKHNDLKLLLTKSDDELF